MEGSQTRSLSARRKMAGRAGYRDGLLSVSPFSGEGAGSIMRGRVRGGADARERHGHGHGDGADSACRRSSRLAAASRYLSIWRFQFARYADVGGRLESDRDDLRRGAGGGGADSSRTAEAGAETFRFAVARREIRRSGGARRRTVSSGRSDEWRDLRGHSAKSRAGIGGSRTVVRSADGDDEVFDGILRRAILRSPRR